MITVLGARLRLAESSLFGSGSALGVGAPALGESPGSA